MTKLKSANILITNDINSYCNIDIAKVDMVLVITNDGKFFNIIKNNINMKKKNFSSFELNKYLREAANFHGTDVYQFKHWIRVDVGKIEVYVGDNICVIAFINNNPKSMHEMVAYNEQVEKTVVKYLRSEGFIGEDLVFVGMQTINMENLPKDWEDK